MDAASRPQPVPTSARFSANIRGREKKNGEVDLINLAEIGSIFWEQEVYSSQRVEPVSAL